MFLLHDRLNSWMMNDVFFKWLASSQIASYNEYHFYLIKYSVLEYWWPLLYYLRIFSTSNSSWSSIINDNGHVDWSLMNHWGRGTFLQNYDKWNIWCIFISVITLIDKILLLFIVEFKNDIKYGLNFDTSSIKRLVMDNQTWSSIMNTIFHWWTSVYCFCRFYNISNFSLAWWIPICTHSTKSLTTSILVKTS